MTGGKRATACVKLSSKVNRPPARRQKGAPTIAQVQQTRIEQHSGPIPSPDVLAKYEQMLPGTAERIIRMAETQQSHNHTLERRQLEADIQHRNEMLAAQKTAINSTTLSDALGQILGFALAAACVAAAVYAGLWQKEPLIAAIFVSLPAVGIIRAVRGMQAKTDKGE